MSRNKTIIGCTMYRGMERFIEPFLNSISKQADQDFLLMIINENIKDLIKKTQKYSEKLEIKIFNAKRENSVLDNKMELINKAIGLGADYLILADSDDLFDAKRVAMYKQYLQDSDFVYNDLSTIDENGKGGTSSFFGDQLPEELIDIRPILDGNFCGFSNTGLNLKKIDFSSISKGYGSIIALDWWFFTNLLLKRHKGKGIKQPLTLYRIYGNNIAGRMVPLDDKKLSHIFNVKKAHYAFFSAKFPEIFAGKHAALLDLEKRLSDQAERQKFLEQVNNKYKGKNILWWDIFGHN